MRLLTSRIDIVFLGQIFSSMQRFGRKNFEIAPIIYFGTISIVILFLASRVGG